MTKIINSIEEEIKAVREFNVKLRAAIDSGEITIAPETKEESDKLDAFYEENKVSTYPRTMSAIIDLAVAKMLGKVISIREYIHVVKEQCPEATEAELQNFIIYLLPCLRAQGVLDTEADKVYFYTEEMFELDEVTAQVSIAFSLTDEEMTKLKITMAKIFSDIVSSKTEGVEEDFIAFWKPLAEEAGVASYFEELLAINTLGRTTEEQQKALVASVAKLTQSVMEDDENEDYEDITEEIND